MKRILTLTLALVMLLSTVLGLASCGIEDNGAIINAYYVGEMYDFDPARAVLDDDAMRVMSLLYEPLFTLDEKGRLKNALAESYEIFRDEENGEYRMEITLKPTMWSDGMKGAVKASDVVYAWKRILEPDFQSPAAPLLYAIENAVEAKTAAEENGHPITTEDIGAAAVNEDTISITFRKVYDADGNVVEPDYDAFLRNLTSVALAPVCQQVVSASEDYWSKLSYTVVSNGPFKIAKLDVTFGEFTLERNPYYEYSYEEKDEALTASPDAHVTPYQIATDWSLSSEKMADLFAKSSLFIMSDMPLALRKEMKDDIEANDTLSTMSVLLNTAKADSALASAAIRRTLSAVLNRQEIADLLVFAKPATGFISGGVFETDSRRDTFREEGGNLLTATEKDPGFAADFGKLSAMQKRLTVGYNDTEADKAVATYLKTAWEALGFTVTLRALSYDEVDANTSAAGAAYNNSQLLGAYYNNFKSGTATLDALIVDCQMLSTDAFTALAGFSTTLNGNGVSGLNTTPDSLKQNVAPIANVTGFANAEYDALIDKAYAESDIEKRAEYLHDAEELLLEEMPVIPLTFGQCHYLTAKQIKNVDVGYYGYPIFTKTKLKNYEKYLPTEDTPAAE